MRGAMPPGGEDPIDQIRADTCDGVHVEVVRAEAVDAVYLHAGASLADAAVTSSNTSPLPRPPRSRVRTCRGERGRADLAMTCGYESGVVLAAVPGFDEGHVVARM